MGELLVVVVLDMLLGVLIHTGERGQHNRSALFAFVDGHTRQFVAVLVNSSSLPVLAFCEVQTDDAVKSGIT